MKPVKGACPACEAETLHIEQKLVATNACLSGTQPKVSARPGIFLVCGSCGAQAEGVIVDGGTHAEFDPADMRTAPPEARP